MMMIFKNPDYDFMRFRRTAFIISMAVIVVGLVFTAIFGTNLSIDFVGGTQVELRFETPISEGEVRQNLSEMGFSDSEVKTVTGNGYQDIMIRVPSSSEEGENPIKMIETGFSEKYPDNPFEVRSEEQVGPKIGRELRSAALMSVIFALFFIIIYIWWRFQFRYGIAAIAALVHDVLIVYGIFNILQLQMSLPVIAAFLTIVGYSLNDTIVIFDRIRENVKKLRTQEFLSQVNQSINETLNRTLMTSLTTFLVVAILYFFGGSVIKEFSFALMVGVIVGTYSSIFIASSTLVEWNLRSPEKRKKR